MNEVAYKPIGTISPSDAEIIEAFSTPPYDDVGVSYKGYSKTKVSGSRWQLNRQETRFMVMKIYNGAFGSTLFDRPNPGKTFYCTKMIIMGHQLTTHSASFGQMHISDVDKNNQAKVRFYFYPVMDDFNLVLDFSGSPRKFTGNRFDLYTQASLGAVEFCIVQLFGWEE